MKRLGRVPDTVEVSCNVIIPSGDSKQTNHVLRDCAIPIENRELYVDLIVLSMNDYDMILGMDWLSKYHATIDFQRKTITFTFWREIVYLHWNRKKLQIPDYINIEAQILLDSGCEGYLVSVMSIEEQHHPILNEVPIIREYPEVFHDNIPKLPPDLR